MIYKENSQHRWWQFYSILTKPILSLLRYIRRSVFFFFFNLFILLNCLVLIDMANLLISELGFIYSFAYLLIFIDIFNLSNKIGFSYTTACNNLHDNFAYSSFLFSLHSSTSHIRSQVGYFPPPPTQPMRIFFNRDVVSSDQTQFNSNWNALS